MEKIEKAGIIAIGVALLLLLLVPSAIAADSVLVTAPNGAENWRANQTITWTAVRTEDPTNDSFNISWSANSGGSYTSLTTGLANTTISHTWNTTPRTDGANYLIRVTKHNTNGSVSDVNDTSNATFKVDNTAPTVVITATGVGLGTDDYAYTQQTTLDFSGTITDATSGNKNISVASKAGTVTGNTWTVTAATLSAGCNVVTATGYDNAGNSGTDTATVCHSPAGLKLPKKATPAPYYYPPPAQQGQPTLSIIPEEGVPDEVKKFGFIALIVVLLFLVWHGSGGKSKPKRRR